VVLLFARLEPKCTTGVSLSETEESQWMLKCEVRPDALLLLRLQSPFPVLMLPPSGGVYIS
jgi:hypothetical protein